MADLVKQLYFLCTICLYVFRDEKINIKIKTNRDGLAEFFGQGKPIGPELHSFKFEFNISLEIL